MRSLVALIGLSLLLPACVMTEGDATGECTDRADNDRDGLYDCDDPDCHGSPDCNGDDDSGADDDAGDDDAGDDDAGDDDAGDDDTGTVTEYSGTVELNLSSQSWPLDDVPCLGEVAAQLGATDLIGSGSCWTESWMLEVELSLDFTCDVDGGQLDGSGMLYMDVASSGLLPDESFLVAGIHSEAAQQIEATFANDQMVYSEVQIDGFLWMSPLPVDPG